jgi:hypothetical protein
MGLWQAGSAHPQGDASKAGAVPLRSKITIVWKLKTSNRNRDQKLKLETKGSWSDKRPIKSEL